MENIEISKLTYFDKVPTRYCENKRGKKSTFHESIQYDKNFLVKFFEKQPYYSNLMPIILKNNRGIAFYRKLIRKGIEYQTPFIRTILRAIEQINKKSLEKLLEKPKRNKYYKIPKLDLLKKKDQMLDKYYPKKNNINKENDNDEKKNSLKLNNSMINLFKVHLKKINKINLNKNISSESILKSTINNSTINNINKNNNLNQTITGDTFHTNDKSETIKNFNHTNSASNILNPKINISRNNKITYTSVKKYFSNSSKKGKYIKSLQLNNILNKCNEDLKFARNLGENVEKNNQDKFVGRMNKRFKTVLKTRDQKIMEDKGKVDKKYHKKEKEKFKELKKNIDMKLSDKYAYINRKQMNEFIREHENILAYQIYLRDMNKFNKIQKKTKEIEKKNMTLVENLLEDSFRQKEFLKYKVDNFYIKHAKQDELNKFSIQNRNRDDYFLNKNGQNNKHLKGTLLPKLIEIKDYCYGRPKHNPIAEMEDNIND